MSISTPARESTSFSLFNTNRKGKISKDYQANDENEISVEQDDIVVILFMEEVKDITKMSKVLVEHHGRLGWIPVSNLILEVDEEKKEIGVERQESLKIASLAPSPSTSSSIKSTVPSNGQNSTGAKKKSVSAPVIGSPQSSQSPSLVKMPTKISLDAPSSKSWVDFIGRSIIDSLALSKEEIKRQESIYEMLITEQDYVRDLEMIIEVYIKPLRKSKITSPKDIGIIFSVWEQLVPVNSELLRKLQIKHDINPIIDEVGDIWSNITDYMKVYTMYCSNHPYALMRLEKCNNIKSFNKFQLQCQAMPECRQLPLSSYLLKPVQRICKYPLLIREIIRHTPPTHKDYANLQQGLIKVETLVTIVNDHAKQTEMVQKMMKIQTSFNNKITIVTPARVLIMEREIMEVVIDNEDKTISRRSRILYIFNDMLVLGKEERLQIGDVVRMKLIASFEFDKLLVSQCATGEYGQDNCLVLSRKDADDSILIQCKNEEERNKIVKQLKGLISDFLKTYFRVRPTAKPVVVEKPKTNHRRSLLEEVQIPEVDNLFIFEAHLEEMNIVDSDPETIENIDIDNLHELVSTSTSSISSESDDGTISVAEKMLAQHTAMSEQITFEMSRHNPESNRNSHIFKDLPKVDDVKESMESLETPPSPTNSTTPSTPTMPGTAIQEKQRQLKQGSQEIKDPRSLTIKRMANSGNVRNKVSQELFQPNQPSQDKEKESTKEQIQAQKPVESTMDKVQIIATDKQTPHSPSDKTPQQSPSVEKTTLKTPTLPEKRQAIAVLDPKQEIKVPPPTVEKRTDKLVEKQIERPVDKNVEKPVVDKHSDKPNEKPLDKASKDKSGSKTPKSQTPSGSVNDLSAKESKSSKLSKSKTPSGSHSDLTKDPEPSPSKDKESKSTKNSKSKTPSGSNSDLTAKEPQPASSSRKAPPPIPQKSVAATSPVESSPTHSKPTPPLPTKPTSAKPDISKQTDIVASKQPEQEKKLDRENQSEKREAAPKVEKPEFVEQVIEKISLQVIQNRTVAQISKPAKSARISGVYKVEEGKREYVF